MFRLQLVVGHLPPSATEMSLAGVNNHATSRRSVISKRPHMWQNTVITTNNTTAAQHWPHNLLLLLAPAPYNQLS